jgi:crotonobetainyl-CoA:carnitine CoA-transferase CaiB-like acyl-CoA transferase
VPAQTAAALATQTGLLATGVGAPASIRSAGGASMGNMSLRFLYPAADGHVSITHVFGEIGGPATGRLMQWVHEAGFCDAAMRDKDWIRYPTLVESGEEPVESWEQVKDTVAAFTSSLTKAELLAGAVERNLLMAPVSELGEVIDLPHLTARSFFATEELPDGRQVRVPGPYARYTAPATAPLPAEQQIPPVRKPVGDDLPLAGVRVLDLTWSVAGPAMTRVLADHGATVVKIESTRKLDAARTFIPFHDNVAGVENSAGFDNMNAGKLSIALDTSTRQGKEVLDDLLRWCDVMVDSLSPRGRRAMGLDDERVRSLNPCIVNMSTSLFGLDGPLADLAGYGNLGAAIAGCYDITGWPDRAPAGPYLAYTDYTSSHLMLVSVMASLLHRHRTGGGQFVELSQTETALQFLAPGLVAAQASGGRVTRIGNDDAHMAPHGVYPCLGADAWVAVACDGDDQWRALCGLMGRNDLADDPSLTTADGRVARRRELDEAVSAWTATLAPDAATLACQGAGVAAHTVQNSPECLADPQLARRGHFVELEHPSRLCLVENTRFRLGRTPGAPRRRAPSLGEHAFDILTDLLGYDSERVAELAAAEILE